MIVQPPAVAGEPSFVIRQNDHTAVSGQLARHFGNAVFDRPEPTDLISSLVEWHDEGWTDLDSRFLVDRSTGLPYHLTKTPLGEALHTSELSPDKGETRHPFIGLVSSMHSCGLYNGRYGLLEDQSLLVKLPPDKRAVVDALISAEEGRQARLREELRADPATAHLADEAVVQRTYKALEFFDLLSLYVQCEHESRLQASEIPHVPVDEDPEHDVTIAITPLGDHRYRLTPYPFDEDPLRVATAGRYLTPQPEGADLAAAWADAEPAEQCVLFCS